MKEQYKLKFVFTYRFIIFFLKVESYFMQPKKIFNVFEKV